MSRELHIVGFQVGRETYGVPITSLHEIVRVPEITAVPDAPEFMEGVINLRGKIVSVIDLRKRFGAREASVHSSQRAASAGAARGPGPGAEPPAVPAVGADDLPHPATTRIARTARADIGGTMPDAAREQVSRAARPAATEPSTSNARTDPPRSAAW